MRWKIALVAAIFATNAMADETTNITITPQSTIKTVVTPQSTVTTITTPAVPATVAPPQQSQQSPPQQMVTPEPFMQMPQPAPPPVATPPPTPPPVATPAPVPVPKPRSIYPRYRDRDCNCGPNPSTYYPRVPADRSNWSTAGCNGVACY